MITSTFKKLTYLASIALVIALSITTSQAAAPYVTQLQEHEQKFGWSTTPSKLPAEHFLERTRVILDFLEARPIKVTSLYESTWKDYAQILKDDVIPKLRSKQSSQNLSKDSLLKINDFFNRTTDVLNHPVVASVNPRNITVSNSSGTSSNSREGGSTTGGIATSSMPNQHAADKWK
ncbi:MAG: hypothetical protein IPN81_11475 [Nitrosomonadales bacterium]|nr:hypothetical protein [Nitrosomonadales bacterium]